jgi:hypothetical protein
LTYPLCPSANGYAVARRMRKSFDLAETAYSGVCCGEVVLGTDWNLSYEVTNVTAPFSFCFFSRRFSFSICSMCAGGSELTLCESLPMCCKGYDMLQLIALCCGESMHALRLYLLVRPKGFFKLLQPRLLPAGIEMPTSQFGVSMRASRKF